MYAYATLPSTGQLAADRVEAVPWFGENLLLTKKKKKKKSETRMTGDVLIQDPIYT